MDNLTHDLPLSLTLSSRSHAQTSIDSTVPFVVRDARGLDADGVTWKSSQMLPMQRPAYRHRHDTVRHACLGEVTLHLTTDDF